MAESDVLKQNEEQYGLIRKNTAGIAELRRDLECIKVDLIGVTGHNGLRGEFRAYKTASEHREEKILEAVEVMKRQQAANVKWMIGLLITVPGAVAAVVRVVGG